MTEFIEPLSRELRGRVRLRVDTRDDVRPGEKYAHWEMKGVPVRVEVGPRDVEAGQVVVVDRLTRQKRPLPLGEFARTVESLLADFQRRLYDRALEFRESRTRTAETIDELVAIFQAGENVWVTAPWCGDEACELAVKERTGGVTLRNYPERDAATPASGACLVCGKPARHIATFGRSY